VRPLIRWHHERPNGTGYPDALKDDELPLLPRILAVADFFDAISTARPYRSAFSPEECREMLSQAASRGDLDAAVVTALLEILGGPSSFWRRHLQRQKAAAV
jgi:putative two-component system response regulator